MKHLFQFLIASSLLLLVTISAVHAQATCPADRSVCENEPSFTLSGGSPTGGTYSGPGVSGGVFNPEAAGVGAKIITYTNPDGVTNCTFTITVRAKPTIALPLGLFPTCINTAPGPIEEFVLLGPNIAPGEDPYTITSWTGPVALNQPGNIFDPALAGVGAFQYTAIATTIHGCNSDPLSLPIAVNGEPQVSCSGTQTVAVTTAPFTLTGGTNLTQHYNGTTQKGSYAGTGVSYSPDIYTFNPTVAGIGTHEITYAYDNGCGEAASCKFNMVVTAAPPTCPADRSVCENEPAFSLTGGNPAGGTYSGPGVSGGMFNPAAAGVGAKTITYTFQDGGNTTTCTFTITVNPVPQRMEQLGLIANCVAASPDAPEVFGTIRGVYTTPTEPVSAVWTGPGITGNSTTGYLFDPALAGPGFHQIYVTATSSHGCISGPFVSSIALDGEPVVSCPNDIEISVFADPFTLTGAENLTVYGMPSAQGQPITDAGGMYSGTGVNSATKVFDPAVAGEGVHQITYTVDTQCGPAASCTFNIKTTPMPVKLVSFAARKNENKILLSWKTSEETGFDRFEIEKSENPKEGFAKIGQVAGKGISHTYRFLDNSTIAPGTPVYYRLKMVDLDGTYAYSKIVWEAVDGAKVMTVYPNPVSGELSVLSQSDLVDVQLINVKGTTVLKQKPEPSKISTMDVSRLPVGTYIIRTKDIHGQIYKSKVVVQR